jgi:hypothetical protein
MQNIINKYTLRWITNLIFVLFLAGVGSFYTNRHILLGKKTEWSNDLKFCTQVTGIDLHQMENQSQKVFSVQSCQKSLVESL